MDRCTAYCDIDEITLEMSLNITQSNIVIYIVQGYFYSRLRPICFKLTLSQTSPGFLRVCTTSFLKTLREKEKLLVTSNFSFFPQCVIPFWSTFCHFHQIQNCRLQFLSVWKSLKFVVWKRVKTKVFFPPRKVGGTSQLLSFPVPSTENNIAFYF